VEAIAGQLHERQKKLTLRFRRISFAYKHSRPVFEELNLTIDAFPAVILGPNGAGKSTLLSLLCGQLEPESGAVVVDGVSEHTKRAVRTLRRRTGWLPQEVKALPGFTTRQQVAYAGWLKGMGYKNAWANALDALRRVDLEASINRPSGSLSGGQRRRLGVAQALVVNPQYLVLDEPYAGLDPEQRSVMRGTLQDLSDSCQIVTSTHQTDDLEDIYRWVVILESGHVHFSGSTQDFYVYALPETPSSLKAELAYRNVLKERRAGTPA